MVRTPHARILAGLAVSMLGAVGCATTTTLISDPVTRQADGWSLKLERFSDGPNEIRPMGYTVYEPHKGARFLHAWLRFRNDSGQTRLYGYDGCDLDLDGGQVLPGMVTRYMGVMSIIEKNESYPPGDENARRLTFSYPEGRRPTRLKCGLVTFEIPQGPSAPDPAR
jgi:hypothetical protein